MSWPSGRQLRDSHVPGVVSTNLSEAHDRRQRQRQEDSAALRIAAARQSGLPEAALDALEPVGSSGKRWRYEGVEYRLHEGLFPDHENPADHGAELFFVDSAEQVWFLRKPFGNTSTAGLKDATTAGKVVGNTLVNSDGVRIW